jgi:uncharacterized damage-inducible protein DinB
MPAPDDVGRVQPPTRGSELDMLNAFLDYHRATLLWKVSGLSDEQLRRPMVPSGVSLLGIVKHLGYVEQNWFQVAFQGRDGLPVPWSDEDPDADFRIEADETTEAVLDFYREEVAHSRQAIVGASVEDVERHPKRIATLRWILIHMIEETARHNGHADILREQIDGATGE